jgi:hypothetical protein
MPEHENRRVERENLMVVTDLRLAGEEGEHRVRIRNLSAKGMMAEGAVRATRGALVEVALEDHGWVPGAIAWVQDNRFGIAFRDDIDPGILQHHVAVHGHPCPVPAAGPSGAAEQRH